MRPITVTLSDLADDPDGIAEDQFVDTDEYFDLDGVLSADGVCTLPNAQPIVITSDGDDSGVTFTIIGLNSDKQGITEELTGENAGAATTENYYLALISIQASLALDTTAIVGVDSSNGAISQSIIADYMQPTFQVGMMLAVDGELGATVQYTMQDLQNMTNTGEAVWEDNGSLTNVSSNDSGNFSFPIRAARLYLNSYTSGSVQLTYIQASGE